MLHNLNLRVIEVEAGAEGYVNVAKLTGLFRRKAVQAYLTINNINNPLGKKHSQRAQGVYRAPGR